jgi:hypothetical protein
MNTVQTKDQPFLSISGEGFGVLKRATQDVLPALAYAYLCGDRNGRFMLTTEGRATFVEVTGYLSHELDNAVHALVCAGGAQDKGRGIYRLRPTSFVINQKTLVLEGDLE